MLRILEAELMDTPEDAAEYDAMDFTESNARFADDAVALLGGVPDPQVLDVGTGTAQIPLLMLARRRDLRVLAVDLAQEMLNVAMRNVARAGHGVACQLARMDAKALRLPNARYDLVMCNSTIHHIPDPLVVFREMVRVVKPGGAVIVRDLLRPASMDAAWAIVKHVAAGEKPKQQQLFFDSLCASLTLAEVRALVDKAEFGRVRVEQVSDRHWSVERRARPATSRVH